MALAAVNVTLGTNLGGGRWGSSLKSRTLPATDLTAANADVSAALANAAANHDSTTEIQAVQADLSAAVLAIDGDVSVVFDTSNITSRNQLAFALQQAMQAVAGSNLLTP